MAKAVYIGQENFTKRNLPSGYTQLEYIQSSGTQYIDTGFKPNNNTRVVCKVSISSISNGAQWIFGARGDGLVSAFSFGFSSDKLFRTDYGTNAKTFPTSLNTTEPIIVDKNKNVTTINGANAVTNTTATFTTPVSLILFGFSNNGTRTHGSVSIYEFKIYDNGTLVRDFVPCKNASGTVGLYDMVNAKFYANAGTGVFTAGATYSQNVARKVKKIYTGVSGVARKCKKGYVGVNGVARKFLGAGPFTIKVTGSGTTSGSEGNYCLVGGESTARTLTLEEGATLSCYVAYNVNISYHQPAVYLNGVAVMTGRGTYTYTVKSNATIKMSIENYYDSSDDEYKGWLVGRIYITETTS